MKNLLIFVFFAAGMVCYSACRNKKAATEPEETKNYMPVPDFIREDIKRVDSFAGGILRKTLVDGKKDSVFIRFPEFRKLSAYFLSPELDSAHFLKYYNETSLMDETTGLLQFIYTAAAPDDSVRKIIVYITPSLGVDKVNRVYLEKESASGDTAIQQKLTWKLGEYFLIVTIKNAPGGKTSTTIDKVIWDPYQFPDDI